MTQMSRMTTWDCDNGSEASRDELDALANKLDIASVVSAADQAAAVHRQARPDSLATVLEPATQAKDAVAELDMAIKLRLSVLDSCDDPVSVSLSVNYDRATLALACGHREEYLRPHPGLLKGDDPDCTSYSDFSERPPPLHILSSQSAEDLRQHCIETCKSFCLMGVSMIPHAA
mmetsp:Transcript_43853/g.113502  ORF Transcript_43853/g.113502 Transcript_43853/m.113502 type:complete len:175 (+) Transcript_43853:975-1499(+)